jgi:glutamate/tyrosine decarboxylase-like PLP-dependent enzyme
VLAEIGWDLDRDRLVGRPAVRVVASVERHATIDRSLRLLGLGAGSLPTVPADGNGAIDVAAPGKVLAGKPAGPTIACLQSGNVNLGR